MEPEFIVDEFYSNECIYKTLGVGNAGGVRICVDEASAVRRMAIQTSAPSARQLKENPYHDRIENDVLIYTGTGKEGDQRLSGVNRRLPEQPEAKFPIYGFRLLKSRRDKGQGPERWQFLGMLEYLRHYEDVQVDSRGHLRNAWLFELRIHREPRVVSVVDDRSVAALILNGENSGEVTADDDRQVEVPERLSGIDPLPSLASFEQIRGQLLNVEPRAFEFVIKDVLQRTGFEDVTVTKYSQDGGVDLNAYPPAEMWPLEGLLVQVQAKRWLHTVGRKEVAELRGSLEPFARGVIVTTSHFSKAAITDANAYGKGPIVLIDGLRFAAILGSLKDFILKI